MTSVLPPITPVTPVTPVTPPSSEGLTKVKPVTVTAGLDYDQSQPITVSHDLIQHGVYTIADATGNMWIPEQKIMLFPMTHNYPAILKEELSMGRILVAAGSDEIIGQLSVILHKNLLTRAAHREVLRDFTNDSMLASIVQEIPDQHFLSKAYQREEQLFSSTQRQIINNIIADQAFSVRILVEPMLKSVVKDHCANMHLLFMPVDVSLARNLQSLMSKIGDYFYDELLAIPAKQVTTATVKDFAYLNPITISMLADWVIIRSDQLYRHKLLDAWNFHRYTRELPRINESIAQETLTIIQQMYQDRFYFALDGNVLSVEPAGYLQAEDLFDHFTSLYAQISLATQAKIVTMKNNKIPRVSFSSAVKARLRLGWMSKERSGVEEQRDTKELYTEYFYQGMHGKVIYATRLGPYDPQVHSQLQEQLWQGKGLSQYILNILESYGVDFVPSQAPVDFN